MVHALLTVHKVVCGTIAANGNEWQRANALNTARKRAIQCH